MPEADLDNIAISYLGGALHDPVVDGNVLACSFYTRYGKTVREVFNQASSPVSTRIVTAVASSLSLL